MRIITGRFKGKSVRIPKGIRPTQDKVRKALFDILKDIKGLSFLELYAGSGAVGLEALSQGAGRVVFIEQDKACIEAIKQNSRALASSNCLIIRQGVERALEQLGRRQERFDIVFLDPPYNKGMLPRSRNNITNCSGLRTEPGDSLAKKTLIMLSRYDILSPYSLIICQHFKKDILPETIGNLTLTKQAKYGDTLLSLYKSRLAKGR